MEKKYTYGLVLAHSGEKSHSRYSGGFVKKNGRSNNSAAYNHDYYMQNKKKWATIYSKKGASNKQENDFHSDFEETMRRTGKTAQELYDGDDFDTILMESGGYDTDNMSPEEKERLRENFKKRFGVQDKPARQLSNYGASARRGRAGDLDGHLVLTSRGSRMTGGMPTSAKQSMTEAMRRRLVNKR